MKRDSLLITLSPPSGPWENYDVEYEVFYEILDGCEETGLRPEVSIIDIQCTEIDGAPKPISLEASIKRFNDASDEAWTMHENNELNFSEEIQRHEGLH